MKDLSLLSRGCGRFVSSDKNSGGHDGRLDVCFTPEDYYIWKSQDSFLRLSSSGRLLAETESALPKTYSTRRGPLLLYSQGFVTFETSCVSETRGRKQQVVRHYTRQVEQQLSTLKELTAAILGYGNTRFSSSRLGPLLFPPLHLPLAPDRCRPSPPPPLRTPQEQPSPELLVQLNPRWLQLNTEQLEDQAEDKEENEGSRTRVRLDLFLQIPCTPRSPTPQTEPQPWVHYVAVTPEEPAEPQLQADTDVSHAEISHHTVDEELHHTNMNRVCDAADDRGDESNSERSTTGNKHGRTGLLPPLTLGQSLGPQSCWEKTDRLGCEGPGRDGPHAQRLPAIAESRPAQNQQDQPKAQRVELRSQENLNRLHQQSLILPVLFPGKEGDISEKPRGEKTERQSFKKETVTQGGGGGTSEKASMILLEPGEEPPPPPPAGALGCVAGRRGPGKQSSLAFLQNRLLDLQDPCESGDGNRAAVRGVLPLELRDLQNDRSVGSLILGPDGEIIQLSLYDNIPDPPHVDGDTQEHALQVLSAEGEKLPWFIVMQPEHTHTEGEVELNTDVPVADIQHHLSMNKQLFNLHRLTESSAHSPSRDTEPADMTNKRTKSSEAVVETRREDAKNKLPSLLPPLKEQRGKEEPRGGDTEAEEEEEPDSKGQTRHLYESHEPGRQDSRHPNEDAVDKRKKNPKKEDTKESSTRKKDMKTAKSAASDGQKTSTTRREGGLQKQKTGNDAQSTRRQKQEERTDREAAETEDRSALRPVKKKMTDREGERKQGKMSEEKGERGEVESQREESAGRRRRRRRGGRLAHKAIVVENHEELLEKEEVEMEVRLKSTKKPSATQRHNNTTNPEEDTERLSTNADKHSSVQSVTSLRSNVNQRSSRRSAASSSCELSMGGIASSQGRLSSCSTVMVTEEQLMLNLVKPESFRPRKSQEEEEEAAALHLAQRAERRRQEVERKRREQEEKEERKRQEREQTEERIKSELDGERRKRAEELRLKKMAKEEERRKREQEEQERVRREQEQREREKRRQEERRQQMERFQRMREEEEQRRKVELEHRRLEEQERQEEERRRLQEMDEGERMEYLSRKEEEEENRRKEEEERKRRALQAAEEARLQAELLTRQMALLQQQLAFKKGLMLEAGGLEKTQGISRPWIYSYFTLLQLLGLNPTKAETTTSDL